MKKNKKIILFTILSLLFSTNVYASCTEEEINDFKKIEDEYKITYEYDKERESYNLILNKGNPEMYDYVLYVANQLMCEDIDEKTTKCYYFAENKEYRILITGQTESCNDTLKDFIVKTPRYNKFSEDPLCEGIEEFALCQSTYDKEIDYETFVSRVNTYKKTKTENEQEIEQNKNNEQKENILNSIVEYIKNNLLQIIVITIFIILIVITIIITAKQAKKSRRLE